MINKNYKKAINLSKKALTLVLAFMIATLSIPFTGFAASDSLCNYLLVENDFEQPWSGFVNSNGTWARVDSPDGDADHGMVIEKSNYNYTTNASDGTTTPSTTYLMTYYTVLERAYEENVDRVAFSTDVMFDDYMGGTFRFLTGPRPVEKADNSSVIISFTKDGKIITGSAAAPITPTADFENYKEYELGRWYTYKVDINLNTGKISFWIDDTLIIDDQPFTKRYSAVVMENVMTTRFEYDKVAGKSDEAFMYLDNWQYWVPVEYILDGDVVELSMKKVNDGATISAKSLVINSDEAVLIAATYKGNEMLSADIVDSDNINGILTAVATQTLEKGNTYRFFLMDNIGNIRPLMPQTQYTSYAEKDYEDLEDKWREFIVGPANRPTTDVIESKVKTVISSGLSSFNSMNKAEDREYLWSTKWSDSYTDLERTNTLNTDYSNIYKMARAYAMPNGNLTDTQREDIKNAVKEAMEWMHNNRYSKDASTAEVWIPYMENSTFIGNWWDWYVGAPEYIVNTLMLMHDEFTDEEIAKYLEFYLYLTDNYRKDLTNRGYVIGRTYNRFGADILMRDEVDLFNLVGAYPILFKYASNGEGMYEDFSYLAHCDHPYTGVYGADSLLDRMISILSICEGTPFELPDYMTETYLDWVFEGFAPLMYKGGMMAMVRGRDVASNGDIPNGAFVIESMLNMVDAIPEADAYRMKQFFKRHLSDADVYKDVRGHLDLSHIIKLESILNDDSIPNPGPLTYTRIYYNMDRVVHQRPYWTAGLAMSSERTSNYEAINNQNRNGWYSGDGMLYVYTDRNQYDTTYFKFSDPYKRPGTTEDTQKRVIKNISMEKGYFPESDFVGGIVMDDLYSVSAMDFKAFHNEDSSSPHPVHYNDLSAKKSWFMFDDVIICLGSAINQTVAGSTTGTNGYKVYTTIDNRKMTNEEAEVNGREITYKSTSTAPISGTATNAKWAHFEGVGGYFFPEFQGNDASYATILNYRQVISNVDSTNPDLTPGTTNYKFFEMWFDHGEAPKNGKYAYALLPAMTKAQTIAYADDPNFKILANDENWQIVEYSGVEGAKLIGYVFWNAGEKENVSVSNPVTLMKKEKGNVVDLAFSDPTQKLTGNLTITIAGEFTLVGGDDEIKSVTASSGKTTIVVGMNGSDGKTLKVKLQK